DVPGKCSDYPKLEVPSGFGLDVHTTNSKSSATLTYNFDGVFGPRTTQEQIYEKVASPILEEVMQGYSCTIFAYGQTGTGKTYTMQGDLESANLETSNGGVVKGDPLASLQVSTNAGLIPRTLHNLFYILDKQSADYKVHVSYVELYNEELVDLLSSGNSGKGAGIKLLDSGQDKGMFILNLTEVRVLKAKDAMDLLEDGTQRRKVAAT
ncbi:Kinesin- motor protein, partial [Coemansia sp. RSA 2531]